MLKINELDAFKKLNEVQKEAVLHDDGPLLVLAGAGTGKTGVLTTRLARILMENMALPGEILSVTFTNKAAREMQNRIAGFLNEKVSSLPWLGTFHSISVKFLRRHAEALDYKILLPHLGQKFGWFVDQSPQNKDYLHLDQKHFYRLD